MKPETNPLVELRPQKIFDLHKNARLIGDYLTELQKKGVLSELQYEQAQKFLNPVYDVCAELRQEVLEKLS